MAGTAQQFLNVLRSFLGIREEPDGSNRTVIGRRFGWNGVPWCAETQSVAARDVGINFWTASTDVMEAWARQGRFGAIWLPPTWKPRPGDLCIWDYKGDGTANHVSAVEVPLADGRLQTIGGNESNRVMRAVRSRTHLRGFIRLPFAAVTAPRPVPVPKPPTVSVTHPTLREGSRGTAVKEAQYKLNKATGSHLAVDGAFGPATKTVVRNFQRFFKLDDDGILGPKTWGVLDYIYAIKRR